MKQIAIVGAGGIGQRHLQSCVTLPVSGFQIHVVDPSRDGRAKAMSLVDGAADVRYHDDMETLPTELDLAIVATQADIRADVIRDLITKTAVRRLILEKVLFQRARDYENTANLFEQFGVQAWVNCPRRLWPAYRDLAEKLPARSIERISTIGRSWDIGCNAIHFLDMFAFLAESGRALVDDIELGKVHPAKRQGMLHIEGVIRGSLDRAAAPAVRFEIASEADYAGPQKIVVQTVDGRILIEEAEAVTVQDAGCAVSEYNIPFQSGLTAGVVQLIVSENRCALAPYALSRGLHEALLDPMRNALGRVGRLADPEICPVT
jgi:predicted dehydrogenase